MVVPPAPVRVFRVSRQSRLSTNDKDAEIIPRDVHRSPGIYFTAEENPGKPQLGDRATSSPQIGLFTIYYY